MPKSYINIKENCVVNPVSNSAISLCASSTEFTYPKLSACLPSSNGSRLKILAMLFLFVPQESWDLQLRMFGYITCGFPRIFGYVLQVIKYSISVPLDRGGFGWNLMLTRSGLAVQRHETMTCIRPLMSLSVHVGIHTTVKYAKIIHVNLYRRKQ